ncbi:MAG: amino acid ABC transporter permease [Ectothiorhodospiraceae bacterium]|nr:amino acid ABC transporter permease [Ectothiorhodospiraceae bacterium]
MPEGLLGQLEVFFTWQNALLWLRATGTTVAMAVVGCGVGFVLANLLVLVRTWPSRWLLPLRVLIVLYVEVFRRIPFLVLIFLVLFTTRALGLHMPLFAVACVTVTVTATAFIAEIVRAGYESVHRNQWESAAVMNFGRLRTVALVVLPQAWTVIVPPAFSYFVMFIKETSLASQVGVYELMQAGKYFNNVGVSPFLAFGTCLAIYFALSYPLTRVGWRIERRLAHRFRRTSPAEPLAAPPVVGP